MRPSTLVACGWITVLAAAPLMGGAEEIPYVMVFPGANSRATYFTLHNIREAQAVSTGRGVKVGILDHLFGTEESPQLYAGGENFLGDDQAWKLTTKAEHGYWMALVLKEIAPDVEVYALNVSSRDAGEKVSALVRAIDWAIEHDLDVLTYSARAFSPDRRPTVDAAVERANAAGIVTTFIHYGHPDNLLPGGLWAELEDGREPDVYVLHRDYTVLFVHEHAKILRGETSDWYQPFLSISSTSPVTAGVVAMLRSLRPDLTPAGCHQILRASGRPLDFEGSSVPRALDAAAAVRLARELPSVAGTLEATLNEQGVEAARAWFHTARAAERPAVAADENALNELGYRLLRAARIDRAVAVFRLAVEAFPGSANAWDSLGEASVYADDRARATESFERAHSLLGEDAEPSWRLRVLDQALLEARAETRATATYEPGAPTGLTGPYLGQAPPGLEPEVFAPGIVSLRGNFEFAPTFTPDGSELYFSRGNTIMVSRLGDGGWTAPEPAGLRGFEPHITPDGRRMLFGRGPAIWLAERAGGGWTEGHEVVPRGMYATATSDGTMYVTLLGEAGRSNVAVARPTAGGYSAPTPVPGVNDERGDAHPYISPDERLLVFDSFRAGGRGGEWDSDFFVSFRTEEGGWSEPVRLDQTINTPGREICPSLSPDGRYFFFSANGDVYWVAAQVLERNRPR